VKPDDPSIPPEEALYRRVPAVPYVGMALLDEDSGEVTFKRGAFKWDNDGCSCNRHSVLVANQLTWQDVKKKPEHGVMRLRVSDVRENGMGVADDPWPDVPEPMPADVAHALIVAHGLSNRQRDRALSAIARRAELMTTDRSECWWRYALSQARRGMCRWVRWMPNRL
jgi:hypothetical protein